MARWNYFNRGSIYSEWNRFIEDPIAMIDIDSVPICFRKGCWKPLAIIETVFDTGKYDKYTNVVESIAEGLKIPGFLVYYKPYPDDQRFDPSTHTISFKVQRLKPFKSVLEGMTSEQWKEQLVALQLEHDYDHGHRWIPDPTGKFIGYGKNQDNKDSKGNLIKK